MRSPPIGNIIYYHAGSFFMHIHMFIMKNESTCFSRLLNLGLFRLGNITAVNSNTTLKYNVKYDEFYDDTSEFDRFYN